MSYYPDLSVCDYFPLKHDGHLIAVGWLEKDSLYKKGNTPPEFYNKLKELLKNPFQVLSFAGIHECSLCLFESEKNGKENLFVPYNGNIYVCPELITHYLNAHFYCPPTEFINAVLECPNTRTMDYKRKLLQCNGNFLLHPEYLKEKSAREDK